MPLPREEVLNGLQEQLTEFEELVRSLDRQQWNTPTRCEGWTVADIAAHWIGTLTEVVEGRTDQLGSPEVAERIVQDRRGRSPQELADELATTAEGARAIMGTLDDEAWDSPAPGGVAASIGVGVEALWYDAYVHTQDIRAALGLPEQPGPGLKASVVHVADMLSREGWGPATLALDGMPEYPIGEGNGRRIEGDPLTFVLVATGRHDPSVLGLDETVNVYRPR